MIESYTAFFDETETTLGFLSDSIEALDFLGDIIERERYQGPEINGDVAVSCFMKRSPMHLAILRAITRDIKRLVSDLDDKVQNMYKEGAKHDTL